MKKFREFSRTRAGFSLLEMLVAMSVMLVMLTFLGSMVTMVSGSWLVSREKLDNFSRGRALLNALNRDLSEAVIRQDLPAFIDANGNSALSFYTRQVGAPPANNVAAPVRPLSFVTYALSGDHALQRTALAFDFSSAGSYPTPVSWSPFVGNGAGIPSSTEAVPQSLCRGVFGFAFTFFQSDGTYSRNFVPLYAPGQVTANANPTCAVRVSLIILGDQAFNLLTSQNQTKLANGLLTQIPDPTQSTGSVKAAWDAYLGTLGGNYPPAVLQGIRTYERTIWLNQSPAVVSP